MIRSVLPSSVALWCSLLCACRCPATRKAAPSERPARGLISVTAPRFDRPVVLDGRLIEPIWATAVDTGGFVSSQDGKPRPNSPVNASAKLGYDDGALYVGFTVHDRVPVSPFSPSDRDPHLWERSSAVELMIQPGDPGNNQHYYEVQVDVAGAVWDTRFDDYNQPISGSSSATRRYGHQDWRSGVRKGVLVDKAAGNYVIELALPWSALTSPQAKSPPREGDVWRINLYSFRDGQRHALAWSPILGQGNFHRASRFGRVTFGAARSRQP